jgi:hypothetical protein
MDTAYAPADSGRPATGSDRRSIAGATRCPADAAVIAASVPTADAGLDLPAQPAKNGDAHAAATGDHATQSAGARGSCAAAAASGRCRTDAPHSADRERGEREAALNDEAAQFNRAIAANLPAPARGVAAQEAKRGGGIFQIKRMTYDDAAFEFYGWNKDMGRRTPQLIEVRKGDNADMRIAVVRRMIAIIRQFEKEDFTWETPRLGRVVVLSARLSDNAALESYLMHEFFDDPRVQ